MSRKRLEKQAMQRLFTPRSVVLPSGKVWELKPLDPGWCPAGTRGPYARRARRERAGRQWMVGRTSSSRSAIATTTNACAVGKPKNFLQIMLCRSSAAAAMNWKTFNPYVQRATSARAYRLLTTGPLHRAKSHRTGDSRAAEAA